MLAMPTHIYEVRPRKDRRGFERLWDRAVKATMKNNQTNYGDRGERWPCLRR